MGVECSGTTLIVAIDQYHQGQLYQKSLPLRQVTSSMKINKIPGVSFNWD